ncbi:MAG: Tfp pilus assembly protein PilF, partial [Alteromonadaceae bacterium]
MFKRILLITSITLFTLSCDKNLPDGHYQNALNLISENNYAAAIIELRNAVKSTPSIAKYRLELSKAYIHQKQFLSAEKELKKALELGQPLHEVLPYLAIILNKNNKLVELSELNLNSPQLSPEEKAKIGFFKTKALTALKEDKKANDVINKIALLETTSLYKAMTSSFIDIIAH